MGAVLTQKQPSGEWRPVSYISRALTATEQWYAQIEKEALAVTWACERFQDYLVGLQFHIEFQTDHKPLVPLLTSKNLDELPIRVQRFRLRLMRFSFSMSHVPGKELVLADTLSRAPVSNASMDDKQFQQEVEMFDSIIHQLPASEQRLHNIMEQQHADETCQQLVRVLPKRMAK